MPPDEEPLDPPPLPVARGNPLAIAAALQSACVAMGGALAVMLAQLRAPTLRARGMAQCARLSDADRAIAEQASVALAASGVCPRRAMALAADLTCWVIERHWSTTFAIAHALRRCGHLDGLRLEQLLAPVRDDPEPRYRLLEAAESLARSAPTPRQAALPLP